jgi:hypothetical protein
MVFNTGALYPVGSTVSIQNLIFKRQKSAKARGLAIGAKTMEYQVRENRVIRDGLNPSTLEFVE